MREGYPNIRAYARYEINGKTVLHVSPGFLDGRIEVGSKATFSSHLNDSPEIHDLGLSLGRSIFVVDKIRKIGKALIGDMEEKGGYYVTVSLDIDSMPVSRKAIDGFVRKNY